MRSSKVEIHNCSENLRKIFINVYYIFLYLISFNYKWHDNKRCINVEGPWTLLVPGSKSLSATVEYHVTNSIADYERFRKLKK